MANAGATLCPHDMHSCAILSTRVTALPPGSAPGNACGRGVHRCELPGNARCRRTCNPLLLLARDPPMAMCARAHRPISCTPSQPCTLRGWRHAPPVCTPLPVLSPLSRIAIRPLMIRNVQVRVMHSQRLQRATAALKRATERAHSTEAPTHWTAMLAACS